MQVKDHIVFVTGANRGIGKALVEASLKHGAAKVYAAARDANKLPDFQDKRVVPITLDIANAAQIRAAAEQARDVNILINNAGVLASASVVDGTVDDLRRDMEVNYFGTLAVTRAFIPAIAANGGGAIASISSVVGLVPMAAIGGYSASKAALFSAIQSMRVELKAKKISVHGIFPGPIDTDMARDFPMKKTSAETTAENILRGIEAGHEDIFPDPMAEQAGKMWGSDPKALERQFAGM